MSRPSLEAVAEAIPHIAWLADAAGSTDYVNERGSEFTGVPRQKNYGWGWLELVHPDDVPRAQLGWQHATRTVTPYELSYRLRRGDGAFRWHACRALPVRGQAGEILRWIGTADDVTDPQPALDDATRIDRQMAELQAMLDAAPEGSPQRFGHVDADQRTHRLNEMLAGADDVKVHAPHAAIADLSSRDLKVAGLVGQGYTNAEIANRLGFSLRTIEASRARLRTTLGLRRRADLVRFAREAGLSDQD